MPILVAFDECAACLNQVEALARTGLEHPKQAQVALLAILQRTAETRRHVMDVFEDIPSLGKYI